MAFVSADVRNPAFLGYPYLAGARVLNQRTRTLDFTASGKAIRYAEEGQRWSMSIPVVDESGSMSRRLQAYQARDQTTLLQISVPQSPDISSEIPLVPPIITVSTDQTAGSGRVDFVNGGTVGTDDLTLYTGWFFKFKDADHHKVYMVGNRADTSLAGAATSRVTPVPNLTAAIKAGDEIELWPKMRCVWQGFATVQELTLERRVSQIYTCIFDEAF